MQRTIGIQYKCSCAFDQSVYVNKTNTCGSKSIYFSKQVNSMIKDYFNNSASQFASFFTNETDLNLTDLEELKQLVEQKIKTQKKSK